MTKNKTPREYTTLEIQNNFINMICSCIYYWEKMYETNDLDTIFGLMHSTGAVISGETINSPGFILIPSKSKPSFLNHRFELNEDVGTLLSDISDNLHYKFIKEFPEINYSNDLLNYQSNIEAFYSNSCKKHKVFLNEENVYLFNSHLIEFFLYLDKQDITLKEKLVYSLYYLCKTIAGETNMPKYHLAPLSSETDVDYYISLSENYYPVNRNDYNDDLGNYFKTAIVQYKDVEKLKILLESKELNNKIPDSCNQHIKQKI